MKANISPYIFHLIFYGEVWGTEKWKKSLWIQDKHSKVFHTFWTQSIKITYQRGSQKAKSSTKGKRPIFKFWSLLKSRRGNLLKKIKNYPSVSIWFSCNNQPGRYTNSHKFWKFYQGIAREIIKHLRYV